ncbi:hypothetical protein Tco_0920326 [Tanacetum coccineum]
MVWIEALTDDQLATKMSVLHCLMMGLQEKCYAYQGLESQVSGFKKRVTELNDKLSSFNATFVKSKDKGKDRKKKIKSLSKNLEHLTTEVARLYSALNQATVLEAERDAEILHLRASPSEFASLFQSGFQSLVWKFLASDGFSRVQGELLSLAASAGFERSLSMDRTPEEFVVTVRVSHPLTKELIVIPVSESLEFVSNVIPSYSAVVVEQPSIEQNKEWVCSMVDISDTKMADGVVNESVEIFVQGVAHLVNEIVVQTKSSLARGLELASSGPNDVVVSFSARETKNVTLLP